MARSLTSALVIVMISLVLGAPAVAGNPCSFKAQKQQLDFQKHQLDFQKHQIDQQYPGPANAAYRESLKRQLEAQRRQLDFQKHQLDLQKRQCKAAYKPHKPHHKHPKHDKDHDRD